MTELNYIISKDYDFLFDVKNWQIIIEDHPKSIFIRCYTLIINDSVNNKVLRFQTEIPDHINGKLLWERLWYYAFKSVYQYVKQNLFLSAAQDIMFDKKIEKHIEKLLGST